MSPELKYLAFTALLTAALWIPYIIAQLVTNGPLAAQNYVDPTQRPVPLWGQRANRAHINAVETFAPFAALVLLVHITGKENGMTAFWAISYFWLRLAHAVIFLARGSVPAHAHVRARLRLRRRPVRRTDEIASEPRRDVRSGTHRAGHPAFNSARLCSISRMSWSSVSLGRRAAVGALWFLNPRAGVMRSYVSGWTGSSRRCRPVRSGANSGRR